MPLNKKSGGSYLQYTQQQAKDELEKYINKLPEIIIASKKYSNRPYKAIKTVSNNEYVNDWNNFFKYITKLLSYGIETCNNEEKYEECEINKVKIYGDYIILMHMYFRYTPDWPNRKYNPEIYKKKLIKKINEHLSKIYNTKNSKKKYLIEEEIEREKKYTLNCELKLKNGNIKNMNNNNPLNKILLSIIKRYNMTEESLFKAIDSDQNNNKITNSIKSCFNSQNMNGGESEEFTSVDAVMTEIERILEEKKLNNKPLFNRKEKLIQIEIYLEEANLLLGTFYLEAICSCRSGAQDEKVNVYNNQKFILKGYKINNLNTILNKQNLKNKLNFSNYGATMKYKVAVVDKVNKGEEDNE